MDKSHHRGEVIASREYSMTRKGGSLLKCADFPNEAQGVPRLRTEERVSIVQDTKTGRQSSRTHGHLNVIECLILG